MIIRFVLAFKPQAKVKRCHECFIKNNMFFVSFDIINKNMINITLLFLNLLIQDLIIRTNLYHILIRTLHGNLLNAETFNRNFAVIFSLIILCYKTRFMI